MDNKSKMPALTPVNLLALLEYSQYFFTNITLLFFENKKLMVGKQVFQPGIQTHTTLFFPLNLDAILLGNR